jgi:hypothetical protein
MSLRSRAPETLWLLIVLVGAATVACGPVGRRVVRATDAEAPPEGGSGGDSATGGSTGTGGRTGGGTGGFEVGTGGATGGSTGGAGGFLEPDASLPPDSAPPATGGAPGRMDAAPLPRDTSPPDLPPPPPDLAPASTLNNGLVSRWKLDDGNGTTARDAVTATGDDGALSGGTTWTQNGFPGAKYQNGGALTFDGTDGVANLSGKGAPAIDQAHSIALWVNYASVPANTRPFIGLGASGTGRIKVGFNMGAFGAWKGNGDVLVTAAAPGSGWHHVAYTFDGTTRRLYVDGAEKNSSTTAGDTGAVAEGHVGSYGTQHFAGTLDELRLYRRALTAGEVGQLAGGNE